MKRQRGYRPQRNKGKIIFFVILGIILASVCICFGLKYKKEIDQQNEICTRYNLTKEGYKKTLAIRKSYQESTKYTRTEEFLGFYDEEMLAYLSKDRYENGEQKRELWDSNEAYEEHLKNNELIPVYAIIESSWLDDLKSINLKEDVLSFVRAGVYEQGSYNLNEDFYYTDDKVTKVVYHLEWQSGKLTEQYEITYSDFE